LIKSAKQCGDLTLCSTTRQGNQSLGKRLAAAPLNIKKKHSEEMRQNNTGAVFALFKDTNKVADKQVVGQCI
jgi:hypothetical protein